VVLEASSKVSGKFVTDLLKALLFEINSELIEFWVTVLSFLHET
jgi:hypothetical protein